MERCCRSLLRHRLKKQPGSGAQIFNTKRFWERHPPSNQSENSNDLYLIFILHLRRFSYYLIYFLTYKITFTVSSTEAVTFLWKMNFYCIRNLEQIKWMWKLKLSQSESLVTTAEDKMVREQKKKLITTRLLHENIRLFPSCTFKICQ